LDGTSYGVGSMVGGRRSSFFEDASSPTSTKNFSVGRLRKTLSLNEGVSDTGESATFFAAIATADPSALLILVRVLSGGVGEGTGGGDEGYARVFVDGVITDEDEDIEEDDALAHSSSI
jgi:hypothetical protein